MLHILYLEDDPRDAELVEEILAVDGIDCRITRVDTEADFIASLEQGGFDLIFADYTLPSFDGLSALKIAQQNCPHLPFIFVSGTLDEEVAIEALKIGATDYVFKTRLSRIVPSVERAIDEARERTKRRQAEAELIESEQKYRTLFDSMDEGFCTIEVLFDENEKPVDYSFLQINPSFERQTGIKNAVGRRMREIAPHHEEYWFEIYGKIALTGEPMRFENEAKELGRWYDVYAFRVGDPKLRRVGILFNDITERRRTEEELRASEEKFRDLVENLGEIIYSTDSEGKFTYISPAITPFTGYTPSEVIGSYFQEFIHPEDLKGLLRSFGKTLSGQKEVYEFRTLTKEGQVRWVRSSRRPIPGNSGVIGVHGVLTDITERKRGELLLSESEQRFRTIFNEAGMGITLVDLVLGEPVENNRALQTMLACSHEELSRFKTFDELTCEEDREADAILFRELCNGEHEMLRLEKHFTLRDGSSVWANVIFTLLRDPEGRPRYVIAIHEDITERKRGEAELKKAFDEIQKLREQLYRENIVLREEIDKTSMFEEIVGESSALQAVLALVAKVAPTDSTVLITGETGTGKELIARAIHKRSKRSSRAFVSVNCAAIPATLIASELFGHEKGAFTGAMQRRLGRFEVAEGGTIFLDEIGELPAEMQIALLRILQEREFERVGGNQPIRADVRVITATNRDLESAIAAGTFRKDLFYRLNVFPIKIPPLRERREDINTLVEYFIHRYSRKAGKRIGTIEKKTLELLESYSWPGNIRELQNVIERSVIVCETDLFSVDPSWLSSESSSPKQADRPMARRTAAQEKEEIEKALAATGGRVSGPFGAAAQLGMPASTLESKIRTLKINKYRFKS